MERWRSPIQEGTAYTRTRNVLIKSSYGVGVAKIAAMALMLLLTLVLARLLGSIEYGIYAYAVSWAAVLGVVAVAGLDVLSTREISAALAIDNSPLICGVLVWSRRIVMVLSMLLAFILAVATKFSEDPVSAAPDSLLIAAVLIPGLALTMLVQGQIRGFGQAIRSQLPLPVVVPVVALAVSIPLLLIFEAEGWLAVAARGIALAVALLVGMIWLNKSARSSRSENIKFRTQTWTRSAANLGVVAIGSVINAQVGVLALGLYSDVTSAGLFDVSYKLAALIPFVLVVINIPLGPVVARLYNAGNQSELTRLITHSARIALAGALPVLIIMLLFGGPILGLIGSGFSAAYSCLAILCIGQFVNTAMGSVGLLLSMTGNERFSARCLVISVILNVALTFWLVPSLGLQGAAIGVTASAVAWNTLMVYYVRKRVGLDPTSLGVRVKG